MTRYSWHLAGVFLLLLSFIFFLIPLIDPRMNSGSALGFSMLLSPGTLAAALVCLFE